MKRVILTVCVVSGIIVVMTGCAQVMAAEQPPPLGRSILTIGADRSAIIGVLGGAIGRETSADGSKCIETYSYSDGGGKNHPAWKTTRIVVYTAGDLVTLWLSQVIWMPLEFWVFDATDYLCVATYERQGADIASEVPRWTLTNYNERRVTR